MRIRPWIVGVVAAVPLVAWALLHPPFRPDPSTVDPAVLEALGKTGFAPTTGVRTARLETVDSWLGTSDRWRVEQQIVPIDRLMTEKRTRRRAHASSEETAGLYVGPIPVVRFSRTWPPLIGDVLPYHFWSSTYLSAFAVDEAHGFPGTKGGRLRARVRYEERFAGGELARTDGFRLQCDVADIVDATSIHSRLTGKAARIECREEPIPGERRAGPGNPTAYSIGAAAYSHWYVFDRGWSIAIEGQRSVRVADDEQVQRWETKLVTFETGN